MRPRSVPILVGITGVATLLLMALVLGFPGSALAQNPPAKAGDLPAGYAGSETCKGCHEDQFAKFGHTRMGILFLKHPRTQQERLGCEGCHGPGKAHAEAGGGKGVGNLITFSKNDKTPVDKRNEICLGCHTKGARLYWQGSAHESRDVACTNCHTVMAQVSDKSLLAKPNELETCGTCHPQKRAQMMRSSHMPVREGKMTCTSCHNPHGTVTQTLLKENGLNETCYACHTEKRGPFLWTHPPVQENCATCHDPHGSNHEKMLKWAKPRMCYQCHQAGPHGGNAYAAGRIVSNLKYWSGKQCNQCHQLIHGSNHPGGQFFTR